MGSCFMKIPFLLIYLIFKVNPLVYFVTKNTSYDPMCALKGLTKTTTIVYLYLIKKSIKYIIMTLLYWTKKGNRTPKVIITS